MSALSRALVIAAAVTGGVSCSSGPEAQSADDPASPAVVVVPPGPSTSQGGASDIAASTPAPAPRELPFDPSDDDRAALEAAGFTGAVDTPEGSGYGQGLRVVGITPDGALGNAGLTDGDLIVELAGTTFPAAANDPIGLLRDRLDELSPGEVTTISFIHADAPAVTHEIVMGRRPPRFNRLPTDADWFVAPLSDPVQRQLIDDVLAIGPGRAAYDDALARNRERFEKRDSFRLRETVQVHFDLAANEPMARALSDGVALDPARALRIAAPGESSRVAPGDALAADLGVAGPGDRDELERRISAELENQPMETLVEILATALLRAADGVEASRADWTEEERRYFVDHFEGLQGKLESGPYLHGDDDVGRERANRRLIDLLARVDRDLLEETSAEVLFVLDVLVPHLERAARGSVERLGRNLLHKLDTDRGPIEIWGEANNHHKTRALFRMDIQGNDRYMDVAARADLDHPISISVDLLGRDLYGDTTPGGQGAGIAGIGILIDRAGDDHYVSRHWSQGVGIGGFGLLEDGGGHDVYRTLSLGQGLGLAGAGVLLDDEGADTYTGHRYTQGVGLAGGVGALIDWAGQDRYACIGRDQSGYGEDGLFEGWGQGVGFGFRHVTSGGIGILYDVAGSDVYEAGNFSQGGGYHYGWGILRDDGGNDRYIGSRYAQGFAAHQAEASFIEAQGDDHYQSLSSVAEGLSWDETSVVFHDHQGQDVYDTSGFSLGAAAHNGMVLFLDSEGSDIYRTVPGRASPNDYHGGHSIAIAVDLGGQWDRYVNAGAEEWNDRVSWKHDVCYVLDLPAAPTQLEDYIRPTDVKPPEVKPPPSDQKKGK